MEPEKPSLKDLGFDLLTLSRYQLLSTLLMPYVFCAAFFVFAFNEQWVLAVLSTMGLSFATYGSTSHDLVHENLKLTKTLNANLLSLVELISFRSGHAYKLSHLHHHKRFPHDDDVEGAASKMTFPRALLEGVIFQIRIYSWAIVHHRNRPYYPRILVEGILVILLIAGCFYSRSFTPVYFYYMCLMIGGSWIIPLVTSYFVHTPEGDIALRQTRLFRGVFFSLVAFNHLYHLEHHLYPMVPHKNWPKLASRLDTYFEMHGVKPLEVKIK